MQFTYPENEMFDMRSLRSPDLYQKILSWAIVVFCATVPFSIAASQAAVITALVAWVLASITGRRWEWKKNVMTVPVVVFLATQLVSIVFSIDVMRSVKEFKSYWHILVFFLVVNRCDEKTAVRGVAALLIAAAVSALVGIGQSLYTVVVRQGLLIDHRITGTMGMHMTYSGVVMMATAVALALAVSGGVRKNIRLLAAGTLAVTLCALALSLTRSAWLGLAAGIVAIALAKERRLIPVLIAALIIGYFIAPKEIRERAFNITGSAQTVVKDGVVAAQGDERPFLWKSGIEVMKHNPWAGVGLLNFRKAYPQYLPYTPKKSFNHAHNNFIHLGAETGVTGLLAFIAMLAVYLVSIVRKIHAFSREGNCFGTALSLGVLGAFAAFLVAGLFEYNFGDSEVAMLFWFLLALPSVCSTSDTH